MTWMVSEREVDISASPEQLTFGENEGKFVLHIRNYFGAIFSFFLGKKVVFKSHVLVLVFCYTSSIFKQILHSICKWLSNYEWANQHLNNWLKYRCGWYLETQIWRMSTQLIRLSNEASWFLYETSKMYFKIKENLIILYTDFYFHSISNLNKIIIKA